MTMTLAQVRDLLPLHPIVGVSPHDLWPAGRWDGEAARTVTGWAEREAVPARLEEVVQRVDDHTGRRRSLARVTFMPHRRTEGLYLPKAILGLWDDIEQRRREERDAAPRARRCADVARSLGAGVYPADPEPRHPVVVLSLEAAERIAWTIHHLKAAADVGDLHRVRSLADEILHPDDPPPVLPS